jgi:probable HAF family extracellular repeat protein
VTSAGKPAKPQPPPQKAAYSVTDLGPGAAVAVNNLGDVAGALDNGERHAAILALNSQRSPIDIGTLQGGATWSFAWDINDSAQVVGMSEQGLEPGFMHAFLVRPQTDGAGNRVWYRDANGDGINDLMLDLDPLTGLYPVTDGVARAINNQGQVVGYATGWNENNEIVLDIAVLWQLDASGDASAVELPGLDGASSYDAFDINSDLDGDGLVQAVGSAYSSDGLLHAVLWEVDAEGNVSGPVDLGYVSPEHNDGEATAINELGQVVGVSGVPWRYYDHAFLVTPVMVDGKPVWYLDEDNDGVNDLMIALGPDIYSRPEAINDSAQVVGEAQVGPNKYEVFLWKNGVMTLLKDLIPSESQLSLQTAEGINEAGQIVARGSSGRGAKTSQRGYLLTPTK